MKKTKALHAILYCLLATSCANSETVMSPYENALGLNDTISRDFHSMIYFPSGISLHFPGYIVAIEKAPKHVVVGPEDISQSSFIQSGTYIKGEKPALHDTKNKIFQFLHNNAKTMFISHIIKNNFTVISGDSSTPYITNNHCFVYNAYVDDSLAKSAQKIDLTKISDWHTCDTSFGTSHTTVKNLTFYRDGSQALNSLEVNLEHDIQSGAYTHILLIIMGWNTSQFEAIRNFNDITGNIMVASLESKKDAPMATSPQNIVIARQRAISPEKNHQQAFRPLIIGVTWPSYWSTRLDNVTSYTNKADDADEIGLTWLNKLVNETLPESMKTAGKKLPIIAVGHSFGARAMTRALFSNIVLTNAEGVLPDQTKVTSPVNLAISLQGAVSIDRFYAGHGLEGAPYRDYSQLHNTKIVLTASSHDMANKVSFWSDTAGTSRSYRRACIDNKYPNIFHCMTASDTSATNGGGFSLCNRQRRDLKCPSPFNSISDTSKVDYIDTSNEITQYNSPRTAGGAHSDIYRLPMGRLLWRLIQEYAMNQPTATDDAQ